MPDRRLLTLAAFTLLMVGLAGSAQTEEASPPRTWAETAKVTPAERVQKSYYGSAVAIADDRLAVASHGQVYISTRAGLGWQPQAAFPIQGRNASIALDTKTLVVGASAASSSEEDRVYIYRRDGQGWTREAVLKSPHAGANDRFGFAVALSGDTLVVTAPGAFRRATTGQDGDGAKQLGSAVYVFVRAGSTWTLQASLKAPTTLGEFRFGSAASIYADTIALTASAASGGGDVARERAHFVSVYKRTGTSWSHRDMVEADGAVDVAILDDTLAVNRGYDKVEVYVRTEGNWALQATLIPAVDHPLGPFGAVDPFRDLALTADRILVGSPRAGDPRTRRFAGAAYVFARHGTTWSREALFTGSDTETRHNFGHAVAMAGDTLVVGAPYEGVDDPAYPEGGGPLYMVGAAYVFRSSIAAPSSDGR